MAPLTIAALAALLGMVLGGVAVFVLLRGRRRPAEPPLPAAPEGAAPRGGTSPDLAAVAHELSGPLGAILAFADDLLRSRPTPEQREALLVIRHQARRGRLLLRGLLDTLRGGPPSGRPERVSPRRLAERAAQVAAHECAAKGVAFEAIVEAALPDLLGSAPELEQVLDNLLRNAVQATPPGGRVSLGARVRGRLIEFDVVDSGPGIPPEALPHIFESFYTTKPPGEGTGLGLSVSQAIVRRHRGVLTAENRPAEAGGGARFVVALPFEDRRWRDREAAPDEIGPALETRPPGRRVLLVEDEVPLRRAVRRYLERAGWVVEETGDGRVALAELLPDHGTCRFDAVVSDIRLPGLTGMTLYERVLKEAPAVARRIVVVTGDVDAPPVPEFRERTGATILEKPYELGALARLLDAAAGPRED